MCSVQTAFLELVLGQPSRHSWSQWGGGTALNLSKPGDGGQDVTQHNIPIGSQERGHNPLPGQDTLCPLLPLQKQSCGLADVKASVLPAVWRQQSQRKQQGHSTGLYWDVVFLQLAAFVAMQGPLDGHHQDIPWKNDLWMQL